MPIRFIHAYQIEVGRDGFNIMRWWTADQHFGHNNISSYTGRPYGNVDVMSLDLINRWNSVVSPTDEVYILGDIAMGKIDDSLELVTKLKGLKILIPGNHDRCFRGNYQLKQDLLSAWIRRYEEVGLKVVNGPIEIDLGEISVLADHFPYRGDSRDQERYLEFRPVDSGKWLFHGHVHEKWRQQDNMINVGVDAWAGFPVKESDLVDLIHTGRQSLVRLSWI